jgi:tripartite-type tricarboxylate transporter receptor subunit TctC
MSKLLHIVLAAVCAGLLLGPGPGAAQPYPSRPIRVIVPAAPGGGIDILARIVGQKLSESWGQPVVIENRAGASGSIGATLAGRAAPDGYTLLMASTGTLMAVATASPDGSVPAGPFEVRRELTPITLVAAPPYLLVIHPSLAAGSVAELIALAKARPGTLNYGSSGSGAASHLSAELFNAIAGLDMVHVPYKGQGQAVADLLAGQVQLMFSPAPPVTPHIRAGSLRALAVTGAKRSAFEASLPTIGEAGLPGYEATGWFGLLGPANLPAELVQRLNSEVIRILALDDVRTRLAQLGAEPAPSTADGFTRYINDDIGKWLKLIRDLGIKMEN